MSASNLTIGLIAGGAVVGGAAIGGAAQAWVAWTTRTHDRKERRRRQKVDVYRDALRIGYSVPTVIREALPLDQVQQRARLLEFGARLAEIRADLSMVASLRVRDIFDEIPGALETMRKAGLANPDPEGVDVATQKNFEEHVHPVLRRLADAMAEDSDTR